MTIEGDKEDLPDGTDLLHVLLQLRLRERGQTAADQLLGVQRLLPSSLHAISNIQSALANASLEFMQNRYRRYVTSTGIDHLLVRLTLPFYAIWSSACS